MASSSKGLKQRGKSLRILHVTQPVEAGTAAVVRRLIERDREVGRVVALGCPRSALTNWATECGVPTIDLPMSRSMSFGDLRAFVALRSRLRYVDVAVLHSSKAGALGRLAARSLARRHRPAIVFYPHGWSWLIPGRASKIYSAIERLLSPSADRIVAVSDSEAAAGREVLSSRGAGHLVTIHNGVDVQAFTPHGDKASRGDLPMVVCVGRLCEQKGQDLLIAAIADEQFMNRAIEVVFVGDGPARDELIRISYTLEHRHRVSFVGYVDPKPYYRAADVVVLPSRWEGFSLVTLEAMACGANVVASEAAAADLTPADGITVLTSLRSRELAEVLLSVLDSEGESHMRRSQARATVETRWSWQHVLPRYDHVLSEVVR